LAKRLEGCAQIKIIGEGRRKIHLEATLQALHCINVEVLPAVPRDTLLQVYAQADVLLLHRKDCASQRNLLPSKLFEYAATGKPILAGVSGFAATFIQNEIPNAVVFRPGNSEDALNEIAKLHFRRQKREKFMHKYPLDTILHSMAQEFTVYFS
jgi:glycosyltransferase involved in cell wall biosynthesis